MQSLPNADEPAGGYGVRVQQATPDIWFLALYLLTQGQTEQARQVMDEARFSGATRQSIEQLAQELAPHRPRAGALAVPTGLRLSPMLTTPPALATP